MLREELGQRTVANESARTLDKRDGLSSEHYQWIISVRECDWGTREERC
jgi:hypothetical protein